MEKSFDLFIDRRNTGACKWEAFHDQLQRDDFMPLTVADMEMPIAEPIKRALVLASEHGVCGYTEPDKIYIDALAGFMQRRHGLNIKKENLLCTSGIVPAFGIIIRALTQVGDGIILQPPVYTPFFDAIKINSRKVLENPLLFDGEKYIMDFDGLEKLCSAGAKLLMLCSPHNPVGRVWTREELMRVSEICKKYNVIILCDEIHNDIVYEREHISLVTLPDMKDMVITCTAMSKTFNLAGLMLSNIFVYNKEIYQSLDRQLAIDGSHCIPYFGRAAGIAAFSECDGWIDDLRDYLHGNFKMCYDYIDKYIPSVRYIRAEGTYLLWLDCTDTGFTSDELKARFIEQGIPVNAGEMFGTGGEGFVRVNIAIPKHKLESALDKMKEGLLK